MVMLWNIDEGLNQIDKFFHNNEEYIKAGACLAVGIVSSGVRNESDPALALLTDFITNKSVAVRTASVCGLGIAYAGTRREELMELLVPIAANTEGVDITEVRHILSAHTLSTYTLSVRTLEHILSISTFKHTLSIRNLSAHTL